MTILNIDCVLYCDFLENYIRAGGQFKNEQCLYFNIHQLFIPESEAEFQLACDDPYDWKIILSSAGTGLTSESVKQHMDSLPWLSHRPIFCDLENPSRYKTPKMSGEIYKEMAARGVDMRLHRIMPIDDLENFFKFTRRLCSDLKIYQEPLKDRFIEAVIKNILDDLPYKKVLSAYKKNKKRFTGSYENFERNALTHLEKHIFPAMHTEKRVRAWRPLKP